MNEKKFKKIVDKFKESKNTSNKTLNMHSLAIKKSGESYIHKFNKREKYSDTRSISKTVLTLLAGILMDLSKAGNYPAFDQNTYVYPIIKDHISLRNMENKNYLEKVQVKHLFNHTVGFDKVLLMRGDIKDMDPYTYLDYLLNQTIKYEPGEYYLYSNAGFYLLSAVLEIFIGEDLLNFADKHLFKPLDIKDYKWEKYGDFLAGATKLWMQPEDLLKIGQVFLKDGLYNDQKIISKAFIDYMLEPSSYTKDLDNPDHTFTRYAYANGIWLGKDSIYFAKGTDGQNLLMVPEKDMIIVTLAHEHDLAKIDEIINAIL